MKVALLLRRMTLAGEVAVDMSIWGDMSLRKVVQTLYGYRNAIAHGESRNEQFERNPLKSVGQESMSDWVRAFTKRLLQRALLEPELVIDLRYA